MLTFLCAAALITPFMEEIGSLVAQNPNQMNIKEYGRIAETLLEKGPCNLLVFGTGRDSDLYLRINAEGTTLFIEDNPKWIAYAKEHNPQIQIVPVTYKTHRFEARKYLKLEHLNTLALDLPKEVTKRVWDVIIVDAPSGYAPDQPGRMQSIYTAATLAKKGCDVFVHDCDRATERLYSDHLFSRKDLMEVYERTRHYRLK